MASTVVQPPKQHPVQQAREIASSCRYGGLQAMKGTQLLEIAEKLPFEAATRVLRLIGEDEAWAMMQVCTI